LSVDIVVGGQFGDEGKGKIAAYLTRKDNLSHVVRAGVGANAGHTVVLDSGTTHVLIHVPAGFVNPTAKLYIAAGTLINVDVLLDEINLLNLRGRIYVDENCGLVESSYVSAEKRNRSLDKVGSTRCGTTEGNARRAMRRVRKAKDEERLRPFLANVSLTLEEALRRGEKVLIEGTQGVGLSLYHGSYPYVTSKDVTTASLLADVGLSFRWVSNVYLVCRTFPVRIADGPLFGEMDSAEIDSKQLWEYSVHMNRPKRVGKFDFQLLEKAVRLTGANLIALTHLDNVDRSVYGCRDYSLLTSSAKDFIHPIEEHAGVSVKLISTSPHLSDVIDLR
jgi:adenylosuccinate synthase